MLAQEFELIGQSLTSSTRVCNLFKVSFDQYRSFQGTLPRLLPFPWATVRPLIVYSGDLLLFDAYQKFGEQVALEFLPSLTVFADFDGAMQS